MVTENRQIASTHDTKAEDRAVSVVLRIGAYASIVLLIIAGIVLLAGLRALGAHIGEAGVLVLMATPILRVLVAAIVFWREGDYRYAWVSVGVFLILVITSVLAGLKIMPTLEH